MVVTPDSRIRLIKNAVKLNDHNQLTFNSLNEQTNYYLSNPNYLEDTNLSYIRTNGVIRVGTNENITYEDLLGYNYVMYQNTHYDNKWFYAYITKVEYKNDGCTELSIETDVFQTWMFEIIYLTSFIEREHVDDDTIGKHTVPENIEHGEYVVSAFEKNTDLNDTAYIICATTDTAGNRTTYETLIGNTPFRGYVIACPNSGTLSSYLQAYQTAPDYSQNIYAVYSVPSFSIANAIYRTGTNYVEAIPANEKLISIQKQTTLDGYAPINHKVLAFPYNYLLVSNNNGQSNVMKYERFGKPDVCEFNLVSVATVGGDTKLIPVYYDKLSYNEQESLIAGKWPTLSWSQDMFTNWISQNAVNIGIGQASSALSIIGGTALLATGAGAGAGASLIGTGILGIGSSMAQFYQHQFDPVSFKGNVNAGSINVENERNGFFFYKMTIKNEYAKIIDNFFEVYGYKVNRIGSPHIHVRTNWDYCKTIDVHFNGNIPEEDMQKLRDLFNSGCTFWHNPATFMNYTLSNPIIV